MTKNEDLFSVIEKLREESFPQLPSKLVERILRIEADFIEARGDAFNQLESVVEKYLAEEDI